MSTTITIKGKMPRMTAALSVVITMGIRVTWQLVRMMAHLQSC
jgi:hypothetical protein